MVAWNWGMMRVMTRERDWENLGKAYAEARKEAGLSQVDVAEQLHVSRTAVQAIERGRQSSGNFTKITGTMRAYARLLGWTDDSPERVAEGGRPEIATAPAAETTAAPKSDLPPAVDRELRSGQTLDYTVVHLSEEGDDDDVRLVVVLKGAENMSEEEIDRRYEEWRRARRHLQAIPGESDTPLES